jgi:hypothetical protein
MFKTQRGQRECIKLSLSHSCPHRHPPYCISFKKKLSAYESQNIYYLFSLSLCLSPSISWRVLHISSFSLMDLFLALGFTNNL